MTSNKTLQLGLACIVGFISGSFACGGKSATHNNNPDTGGSPGDGDGDGDGDLNGGNGGTGGMGGTSTGGAPSTGGGAATGGTNGQVFVTLGDNCASAGSFACAENNPKLALVCGSDGEWEVRETCGGEEFCDFNAGPNEGTCRVPLAVCDDETELLCAGTDVASCNDGGFDATVVEECAEGCEGGECVWVADECAEAAPGTSLINCGEDQCSGDTDSCSTCGWIVASTIASNFKARASAEDTCHWQACNRDYFAVAVWTEFAPDMPMRFSVGPGWGLIVFDDGSQDRQREQVRCDAPVEGCVTLPPPEGDVFDNEFRGAFLIPLSENVVARNLTVETVEPGTTCD